MFFYFLRQIRRRLILSAKNQNGQVAIIFALSLLPILLLSGVAINFSSSLLLRSKLQSATDSTVLALATQLNKTPSQLNLVASAYLASMDIGAAVTLTGDPTVSAGGTEVCIQTASVNPMSLGPLASVTLANVAASACAQSTSGMLEIALVLDNSGSMEDATVGGVAKISALRSAATSFVSSVFSSHPTPAGQASAVKISVVSFQDAVALSSADTSNGSAAWIDTQGQSSWHWKGWYGPNDPQSGLPPGISVKSRFDVFNWLTQAGGSTYAWRGCFESLPYPQNTQDVTPSITNPESLFVPTFAPDEPDSYSDTNGSLNTYLDDNASCTSRATSLAEAQERICKYRVPSFQRLINYWNGPNASCNSQPLLRLTDNQTTINSEINELVAEGATNLNEGIMWGWRTISPNGPLRDGASYASATHKVIVLITDGMNFYPVVDQSENNGNGAVGLSGYGDVGYAAWAHGRLPVQSDGSDYPLTTSVADQEQSPALDELTREACANARTAGVQIYTIGFQATDPISASGQQLLKDCVGDDPTHFFLVSDETSLSKALASVSVGATSPRLVK